VFSLAALFILVDTFDHDYLRRQSYVPVKSIYKPDVFSRLSHYIRRIAE